MNADKEKRMKDLLRQALPPVEGDAEPGRDLWPAVLRRLDAEPATRQSPAWACFNEAWFDGALLAGLVALAAFFPASIPVFLFYL
jgi:hypothetical protein